MMTLVSTIARSPLNAICRNGETPSLAVREGGWVLEIRYRLAPIEQGAATRVELTIGYSL
jgi:hypothetical protein